MRLGGRVSGAIEVLADIEGRRRPVADALKDWGLAHRFAGSGDRAAIGNIVYDALRMKLSHAFVLDDDSPDSLAYGVLLRQWLMMPEEIAAAFEGDNFAPAPLGQARAQAFASKNLDDAPMHVQGDIPDWVVPAFETVFGPQWLDEAKALNERPSLDLRVNSLKSSREKVLKALNAAGAVAARISPLGIRVAPGTGPSRLPNVTAELSFQKGWFEVQDEGSQIVAALVGLTAGEKVLDFCAGGGGKTLAMAAAMGNKGQVHAYDSDRKRLAPIVERLKRAGTHNVQVHDRAQGLEQLIGRMDKVLVDAPCTGTGTWRRRPDTKWRLNERNLQERVEQQTDALATASRYVRSGGELVYVTCSVLPQENEQQIAAFCAKNPEFAPVSMEGRWKTQFGASIALPLQSAHHGLTLSPKQTGTDGFFICALKKVGA